MCIRDRYVIAESGKDRISYEDAEDQTRSRQSLSGYTQDKPRQGWAARAMLFENLGVRDETVHGIRAAGCEDFGWIGVYLAVPDYIAEANLIGRDDYIVFADAPASKYKVISGKAFCQEIGEMCYKLDGWTECGATQTCGDFTCNLEFDTQFFVEKDGVYVGAESLQVDYPDAETFYLKIPQEGFVDKAKFNVSWEGTEITIPTTTTTTTTTTTSSTTTSTGTPTTTLPCRDCPPVEPNCEITTSPVEHNTDTETFNYHIFTLTNPGCPGDFDVYVEVEPKTVGSAYDVWVPSAIDEDCGFENAYLYEVLKVSQTPLIFDVKPTKAYKKIDVPIEGEDYVVRVRCYETGAGAKCDGYDIYIKYECA